MVIKHCNHLAKGLHHQVQEANFIRAKVLPIPHLKQPSNIITALNSETKLIKQHETVDMFIKL